MKKYVTLSLLFLSAVFTEAYNERKVTDYSNPLRGIVPKVVHKDDVDDTAFVELIEKLEGEVAFDAYVKAHLSTPEVAERITELENCMQQLANAVWTLGLVDKDSGLRAATEDAAIVLKNRLEVGDVESRIRKRMSARVEPFQDDLRLTKPSGTKPSDSNSRFPLHPFWDRRSEPARSYLSAFKHPEVRPSVWKVQRKLRKPVSENGTS